jgi:hypothetical protein
MFLESEGAATRGGLAIWAGFWIFLIFFLRVGGDDAWRVRQEQQGSFAYQCAAPLAARLAFPVFFFLFVFFFGTGRLECDFVFFLETGARWS